jgi:ring-1,2-phenylacetyl-CoA epoxidase subunit PaaC
MTLSAEHIAPLAELLLSIADDKLMLGHRNSDWTGLAPILEEDIAFSAIAQDEMAHAQAIYEFVGGLLGKRADDLAFGRPPDKYLCAHIVETPDEFDWAVAIARQFLCDHYDRLRLGRLAQSHHKPLADLAKRLAAEEQVHVEHADSWIHHLGRGTEESRQRLQAALDKLAPLAGGLFEPVEGEDALAPSGLYRADDLFETWLDEVHVVATRAGLTLDVQPPDPTARGGRRGVHTLAFRELLDEMCEVYRIEPNAAW